MKPLIRVVCVAGWWVNLIGLILCGLYLIFRAVAPTAKYRPTPDLGNFFSLAILIFLISVFLLEYVGKKLTFGKSSYFFLSALAGSSKLWIIWLFLFAILSIFFFIKVDISTPNDGGLVISHGVYNIIAHAKILRVLSVEEGEQILNASYNFDVLIAWIVQSILFFYWDGLKRMLEKGELIECDAESMK